MAQHFINTTTTHSSNGFQAVYCYIFTRSFGHYVPLPLAPAEGLGPLRAVLGAFGPLLSSSIQKYTLRQLFGHLILQNPLRFLSHFIWLQEAYSEVREGLKIGNLHNLDHNFRYLEAKFDYRYFIIFLRYSFKILHKKSQVILTNNEGVRAIFPNFDFIWNRENQRHTFIFARNDLKFFVENLRTITQKKL